jgi:hypothetical protein
MTRSLIVLLAGIAVVAAATGTAIAAPAQSRPTRVALTKIEGDTAGLGKAVAAALEDTELEVVPGGRVARAVERLGLDEALGDSDLGKLCMELEVDAVVKGVFDRRGQRLRFTIFADGKKTKLFNIKIASPGAAKFRKVVRDSMVAHLAAAVPDKLKAAHDRSRGEVADDERPAKKKRAADDEAAADDERPAKKKARAADDEASADDDKPRGKAKARRVADADDSADEAPRAAKGKGKNEGKSDGKAEAKGDAKSDVKAADDGDDDKPRAKAKRAAARDEDDPLGATKAKDEPAGSDDDAAGVRIARLPVDRTASVFAARLDVGASMVGRSLEFDGTAANVTPAAYRNLPVPGAHVAAEIYPLVLRDPSSLLAGIGLAAEYDQTMALTLRASDEMTVPLKITERHYSVGARFRLALGHAENPPTVTVGAGYSAQTFMVDRSHLMSPGSLDLPDVDYRMFDPGAWFRMPLGRFAVTVGVRALIVTSAGPIQRADQYGAASVLGGNATIGVEYVFGRFVARLAGEATQLSLSFAGGGALSSDRDGNSATVDVRGATDRYYGGVATVGVVY